ncbi:phospholipase D-like domain-containing protein [Pseudoduganella sp.]|uniref:phospholipase D-like domain-containing protein n=1 Tax=Pseudoduganella sp. TaxID=1880898 RepID=UPI0035AE1AD9
MFAAIAKDIANAKHSVDIITWGFDPGMVLVRNGSAENGERFGDILRRISTRTNSPVKVRLLVWHDDVAAQRMMNNMPGYYGRLFPAIGAGTCGFYSDAHREFNEKWFSDVCSGDVTNIHLHVRDIPALVVPQALSDETLPEGLITSVPGLAAAAYPTHHQKMILIDYERPGLAVGYVMGHNSITDFWDTADHIFRDPRRERIYRKKEGEIRTLAEGDMPSPSDIAYAYRMSERGKRAHKEAVNLFIENSSHIAKPYQDVSCRLRGPVLYDLNQNFCQAWQESLPPSSLFVDTTRLVPHPLVKIATEGVRRLSALLFHNEMDAGFIKRRAVIPWTAFSLVTGKHNVQLLRTQPMHGEKDVKECYANLTRQMRHYFLIQNQYIQYATWADHLIGCVDKLRRGGYDKPIYVFLLTSTPEKEGMDSPTYEVASRLGMSESMVVQHAEAVALAKRGETELPITPDKLQRQGINVIICSLWTCANKEVLNTKDYEEIYIHAKVSVVDDAAFTIGSANLNLRSMALDSELNVLSDSNDVAHHLRVSLFEQCSGDSGPEQFGSMAQTFRDWQVLSSENLRLKNSNLRLKCQLLPFNVARKASATVI